MSMCIGPFFLVGPDEGQVDGSLHRGRQLALRLLCRLLDPLQRGLVLCQVHAVLALELVDYPIHYPLVEIVTAEVGVAVRRLDLEDALAYFQH